MIFPRFPGADEQAARIALPEALVGRTWTDVLGGQTPRPGDTLGSEPLPLPWMVLVDGDVPLA